MADKKQIQLIHIAKQQLNIDDDTYRELLQDKFKVSSSKDLSERSADSLLSLFKEKGFKVIKKKPVRIKQGDKIVVLASSSQRALIDVLKSNIVWRVSYDSWLKQRMKIKKVLTVNDARKVIEGLKGMLGITTHDIEFLNLPFPQNYNIDDKINNWVFDTVNKKLIHVKNGEICRII